MLQDGYQSVLESRNRDEFLGQVVRFTRQLGFETVCATTIIDHFLGESEFITVDNTPANYREVFEDVGLGRQDPVMQHCKHQSVPIIWNRETYVGVGQADQWDEQARYGYHTGIAMALHLPEGRHFFLGVDRDQSLPRDRSELTRLVADLQLFAVHAQEAALRIMMPAVQDPGDAQPDAARGREPALDDGRQDGLGGRQHPRHQRAHGGAAREQCDAQAGLRQQAPSGTQGPAAGSDPLKALCLQTHL